MVGRLWLSIGQIPAQQTLHLQLPFLLLLKYKTSHDYTEHHEKYVRNVKNKVLSTWCGRAGLTKGLEHCCLLSVGRFCPVNNVSKLCEHLGLKTRSTVTFSHASVILARRVYRAQWQTDPREDDVTGLSHCSLPAVNIHHRLLHQHVVQLPPVWPASSHRCSAAAEKHGGKCSFYFGRRSLNSDLFAGRRPKNIPYNLLCLNDFLSPATWAPGFTHWPKSTGSVHLVTVTMASAPLTASSTETNIFTGPLTEWQNLSAPCFEWLHTRTW